MAGVGAPLATAFIRIRPDDSGFGRELKKQVQAGVAPASKALDQGIIRKLGQQVEDANRRVRASNLSVRESEVALAAARKNLRKITADANATDEDKVKAANRVERAELKHAAALSSVVKAQEAVRESTIKLTRAQAGQTAETEKAQRNARAFGVELKRVLDKGIDLKQFNSFAQKLRDIRTVFNATIAPVKRFGEQIAKMAVAAGAASAAVVGAVGLAGGVLALAGALAATAGVAPVAAAGIASFAAAGVTAKIAMLGVGDAIGKALEPVTKDLSRNAKQVVNEFTRLVPALTKAKNAIQDAAFAGVARDFRGLAERFLPTARTGFVRLATVLNGIVRTGMARLNTSTNQWNLASVLHDASRSLKAFGPQLARIPTLLLDIATVTSPVFRKLSEQAAKSLGGVLDRVKAAVDSGALAAAVEKGITAVKQLGGVVRSVFSIIRSAVKAASASFGGDLLGSISAATKKFAEFLKGAQGQEALRTVFAAALPVLRGLGELLRLVGPQLAALAPVVLGLADAFIRGLTPVIPVAGELLKALGTALTGVLPAISALAVALGGSLTSAIQTLQPIVAPLANAVASLLAPWGVFGAFLDAVAPVLLTVATGLTRMLAPLAGGLTSAINALGSVLPGLAEAFVELGVALAEGVANVIARITPHLPAIVTAFKALLEAVRPLVKPMLEVVGAVAQLVATILPPLVTLVAAVVSIIPPALLQSIAVAFLTIVAAVKLWTFAQWLLNIALTANPIGLLIVGIGLLVTAIALIATKTQFFQTLWAGAWQFVKTAAVDVWNFLKAVWPTVLAAIVGPLGVAILFIIRNWERVKAVTVAVFGVIRTVVAAAMGSMVASVNNAVTSAVRFLAALPGRAYAAVVGLGARLVQAVGGAVTAMNRAIAAGMAAAVAWFTGLPGRIAGAVGSLGGVLVNAGLSLMRGLLAGIKAGYQEVKSFVAGIAAGLAAVKGPLPKDRRLLVPHGKAIMSGLDAGLHAGMISIGRTMAAVTAQVSTLPAANPATGGGGVSAADLRAALEGVAIRFDGDGLARLVTRQQSFAAAAGGRR